MAFSKIFKILILFLIVQLLLSAEAKNNEITQTSIKFNKNMEENLVKIGIVIIIAATGLGIARYLHQDNFPISKGVKSLKKVKALVLGNFHFSRGFSSIKTNIRNIFQLDPCRELIAKMNINKLFHIIPNQVQSFFQNNFLQSSREFLRLVAVKKWNRLENIKNANLVDDDDKNENITVAEPPINKHLPSLSIRNYHDEISQENDGNHGKHQTNPHLIVPVDRISSNQSTVYEVEMKHNVTPKSSISSSDLFGACERDTAVLFYIGSTPDQDDYEIYGNSDDLENLKYFDPPNIPNQISYPHLEKEWAKQAKSNNRVYHEETDCWTPSNSFYQDRQFAIQQPLNESTHKIDDEMMQFEHQLDDITNQSMWNNEFAIPNYRASPPEDRNAFKSNICQYEPIESSNIWKTNDNDRHTSPNVNESNRLVDLSHIVYSKPPVSQKFGNNSNIEAAFQTQSISSFDFNDRRFNCRQLNSINSSATNWQNNSYVDGNRSEENHLCDFSHLLQPPIDDRSLPETPTMAEKYQTSNETCPSLFFDDPWLNSSSQMQSIFLTGQGQTGNTYDRVITSENAAYNYDQVLHTSTSSFSDQSFRVNSNTLQDFSMMDKRNICIKEICKRETMIRETSTTPFYGYGQTCTSYEINNSFHYEYAVQTEAQAWFSNQPYQSKPLYARANPQFQI